MNSETRLEKQIDYLKKKVENDIANLRKQSNLAKERALQLNLANLILGATITILLGLNLPNDSPPSLSLIIKNLALLCGVLITIISGVERFSENRSKWVRQRGTVLRLYSLQSEIEFYKAGINESNPGNDEIVQTFFTQYQEVWRESNSEWHRVRGKPTIRISANSSSNNERVLEQEK